MIDENHVRWLLVEMAMLNRSKCAENLTDDLLIHPRFELAHAQYTFRLHRLRWDLLDL